MVVEATYSIGSVPIATTEIVGYGYPTDPLEDGTTEIYITYSEGGINCRVRQAVTITHGVRAIAITTQPTKKTYEYGDTLNMDGAVITATYSDGATATIPVANCDYSPKTLSTVTNAQTITVVYSENGLTREATFTVVVNKKSVTKPTWKTNLTYTGSNQTVTATSQWNNYNTTYMTIGGTTSATNAGTYTATFTLKENYRWADGTETALDVNWIMDKAAISTIPSQSGTLIYTGNAQSPSWSNYNSNQLTLSVTSQTNAGTYTATFTPKANYTWSDGSTTAKSVNWTIGKAAGSLSINKTSITLNTSTTSATFTVTRAGDGAITVSSSDTTVATATLSGTTVTVKSVNNKTGNVTITVKVAAGTNHNAPSNKTCAVTCSFWSFGAGTGEAADATWFAGLKSYLASNKGSSIKTTSGSSIVGATKTVTLTSAVLGATTHTIRVIGVDQDGSNTVTWQTVNCLPTTTAFSASDAQWDPGTDSTAKAQCINYYNAFPGKASIKTVKKGTNTAYNSSSIAYTDETVFIPSIHEMGLANYQYAPSTGEYTQNCSAAYSYYTDNNSRIKNQSDSTSTAAWYWTRSRYTNYANYVCGVYTNGAATYGNYSSTTGRLAPAFVIG